MSRDATREATPAAARQSGFTTASPLAPTSIPAVDPSLAVLGNQQLQALLASNGIRAKLSVSQPDDPSENEADRFANAAMAPSAHRMAPPKCATCAAGEPCRECEKKRVHRKTSSGAPRFAFAADGAVSAVRTGGQPLPSSIRSDFESLAGRDLGDVRVHTHPTAARAARSIRARAYTHGRDIAFAPGEFQPTTRTGLHLLAHEIGHVVQEGDDVIHRQEDGKDAVPVGDSLPAQKPRIQPKVEGDAIELLGRQFTDSPSLARFHLEDIWKEKGHDELKKWVSGLFTNDKDVGAFVQEQFPEWQGWQGPGPPPAPAVKPAGQPPSPEEYEKKYGGKGGTARRYVVYKVIENEFSALERDAAKLVSKFQSSAVTRMKVLLAAGEKAAQQEMLHYGLLDDDHGIDDVRAMKDRSYRFADPDEKDRKKQLADMAVEANKLIALHAKCEKYLADHPIQYNWDPSQGTPGVAIPPPSHFYDVQKEYDLARAAAYSKYPVLQAFEDDPSGLSEIAAGGSATRSWWRGGGSKMAGALGEKLGEQLDAIQTVRENIDDGALIWALPRIVAGTKSDLGVGPDSVQSLWIDEHVREVAEAKAIADTLLAAATIVLVVVTLIPTGGSSAIAGAGFVASVGMAGLSTYQAIRSVRDYQLTLAEGKTAFDRAKAIASGEDASLFQVALDVVGAIADIGAAAHAFKSLVALRRAAMLGDVGALEKLRARGNDIKKGLGDAIAYNKGKSLVEEGRALAKEAELTKDAGLVERSVLETTKDGKPLEVIGGHEGIFTKDGDLIRCSEPLCAKAGWVYERLFEKHPGLRKELAAIEEGYAALGDVEKAKRATRAKGLLNRLERIQQLHGLDDEALAELVKANRGTLLDDEIKFEQYARKGGSGTYSQFVAAEESALVGELQILDPKEAYALVRQEKHHPFFKFLLRGLDEAGAGTFKTTIKGGAKRLIAQKLVDLGATVHQDQIHKLWDIAYPELKAGGNVKEWSGAAKRAAQWAKDYGVAAAPEKMADMLKDFYKVALKDNPEELEAVIKSIDDLLAKTTKK